MKRYAKHAAYAAIALVFLWTVVWMIVAQRIVRQIDAWRTEQAFTLDWEAFDVKGWPFGWRADVTAPRASGAGWAWSGARLIASIDPWNPAEIRVRLPGAQRVTFGARTLALRAARPDAILRLDASGKPARLDLDFEAFEAAVDGGTSARVRKLDASFARPSGDVFDATLNAQAIRLAEAIPGLAAFGTDIGRLAATAQLRGAIPGGSFADAARAWRDAGGTVELTSFALEWGALRVAGEGTLALDAADRPLGAGTVRMAGWSEAIDALQAARAIEPTPAALLKAGLNFLGRVGGGGEPGTVRVPIAAQDGRLVVHRIPVAVLPSLRLE